MPIGFIAKIRNTNNFFVIDQLSDFLNHLRFIDLIWNFSNNNSDFSRLGFFNISFTSEGKFASARIVHF